MTERVLGPTGSPRRRWTLLLPLVAAMALGLFYITGAQAVHQEGLFELEGDTLNNLTSSKLGTLQSNITATATSINVCQTATGTPTGAIIIDSEQMNVTANSAGNFGGSCSGTKRTYTVTRGYDGPLDGFQTAASHSGGADVTLLVTGDPIAGDDWSNIWDDCQTQDTGGSTLPDNIDGCSFVNDKIGTDGDNTYFTGGGSKDRNDISQWVFSTNDQSPDKNDIVNAFAAAYHGDSRFLYFGADRYQVGGDAQMGFWFFADPVCLAGTTTGGVECPNDNPGKFVDPETGDVAHHSDGDILAIVNFNNGGAIGLSGVYVWSTSAGEPVQQLSAGSLDCSILTDPNDKFCTVSNKSLHAFEPPWGSLYKGKLGGSDVNYYQTSAFIEGGVDLGQIPGAATCFSTFLAETRSSSGPDTGLSLDAQLKDLAFGQFQQCGTEVKTTPSDGDGGALTDGSDDGDVPDVQIGTGDAGVDVTDVADVTVSGIDTWSGTVNFFLCGPLADTSATCDTGGVDAGSDGVSNSDTQAMSDVMNITEVGYYCWRGEFTSDTTGLPDGKDDSAGECFEVTPVTPDLSTTAWSTGDNTGEAQTDPVAFGDQLFDRADLSGTANQPGDNGPGDANGDYKSINADNGAAADGTITFTLVGPDGDTTDCTTVATSDDSNEDNPEDVTVSGDGDYYTSGFTPDTPGDFHWKASYDGDSPNTLGTTHNDNCDETGEDVTVQQVPTTIKTAQFFYPNDTATVGTENDVADLPPDGQVTFSAYVGDDDTTVKANCEAGADTGRLFTETVDISGTSPQSVSTSNTDDKVPDGTIVYWNVKYDPKTDAFGGRESICTETTTLSITDDDGPGTEPSS